MTIADLLPSVQKLSHTEKLLLLKVLVSELLAAEGIESNLLAVGQTTLKDGQPSSIVEGEPADEAVSLQTRYDFLRKPLLQRRQLLSEQAALMQAHYETDTDWQELRPFV